ncbi:hypothetical protein SAMN05216516_102314 [Izhakiella capsodis]|uniref:Uncharacterized protein n=1 Tax=Izhakiella capsodis TaxID=1367852 RepID=A0A1I4W6X5_9GAMM|nr:hypothetical protein [Izhakiella capsodis]SFN08970.1 hypothetical protein SAMN05216516_102314 [Izhakiella capsodis]
MLFGWDAVKLSIIRMPERLSFILPGAFLRIDAQMLPLRKR